MRSNRDDRDSKIVKVVSSVSGWRLGPSSDILTYQYTAKRLRVTQHRSHVRRRDTPNGSVSDLTGQTAHIFHRPVAYENQRGSLPEPDADSPFFCVARRQHRLYTYTDSHRRID